MLVLRERYFSATRLWLIYLLGQISLKASYWGNSAISTPMKFTFSIFRIRYLLHCDINLLSKLGFACVMSYFWSSDSGILVTLDPRPKDSKFTRRGPVGPRPQDQQVRVPRTSRSTFQRPDGPHPEYHWVHFPIAGLCPKSLLWRRSIGLVLPLKVWGLSPVTSPEWSNGNCCRSSGSLTSQALREWLNN